MITTSSATSDIQGKRKKKKKKKNEKLHIEEDLQLDDFKNSLLAQSVNRSFVTKVKILN